MAPLVVRAFSLSLDGYGAGPGQDLQHLSFPIIGQVSAILERMSVSNCRTASR
jgi:hypothetical protein